VSAARRTAEDCGHVLEQLEPAVEEAAGDHLEADVRVPVVDPLASGDAGDDGKMTTRKRSTRPASSRDRHRVRLPIVRGPRVPSAFSDRTASTGSSRTRRVLAHANGSSRVEANTTLDASVSCVRRSSSDAAAKPDIRRYVVAPIRVV
jgi:hypothetical protein